MLWRVFSTVYSRQLSLVYQLTPLHHATGYLKGTTSEYFPNEDVWVLQLVHLNQWFSTFLPGGQKFEKFDLSAGILDFGRLLNVFLSDMLMTFFIFYSIALFSLSCLSRPHNHFFPLWWPFFIFHSLIDDLFCSFPYFMGEWGTYPSFSLITVTYLGTWRTLPRAWQAYFLFYPHGRWNSLDTQRALFRPQAASWESLIS
jgi:hypothetical protein